MDEAESYHLLANLINHATQSKFVWRYQWQVGNLLMWGNHYTLPHRDRLGGNQRRMTWYIQLLGSPSRTAQPT